jgi:hypothetical protein
MADIVPISITLAPNLFHHNNVGGTYAKTSNFKVEPIRFVPLYYVAMLHSMVTVIEAPFITTPTHVIVSMRFKPQIPRGIDLVSMHTKMPKKVDKTFAKQPLNPRGGRSGPPGPFGPSRYFGLPTVKRNKPPLPPNMPYHRPLNYLGYVKDSNPNVHVRVFLSCY